MDLIQTLIRLALVDEEWDDKARRYQEARQRLTDLRELEERKTRQEALEASARAARTQLADLELELASLQERSRQVERDLYGGGIGSPRELENLRRESEQLRHRLAQLEDEGLELISRSDDLDARVQTGRADLEAFQAAWEAEMAAMREAYQTLRARLQELQGERERLRASVPARELALYDELRRTKGGRPLAPMRDGVCQVCHVVVPRHKALVAEGGQDAVATCEGCGRILYQA